jgi:hypothetical protein
VVSVTIQTERKIKQMNIKKTSSGRKKRIGWKHYLAYMPPNGIHALKNFIKQWKAANIEHWYKDPCILENETDNNNKSTN